MSHIVTCSAVELRDLEAIKRACQRLGWVFHFGQETFRWYGVFLGDTEPSKDLFTEEEWSAWQAMTAEQRRDWMTTHFGKCQHAISIPNCAYEVGLVYKQGRWLPLWDSWQSGGLDKVLTPESGLGGLAQAYAVEKIKLDAESRGWSWSEEVLDTGKVCVRVNTGGGGW